MARKVILDVDPGIDDAVAVAMALFDPRLDVVAVTAVAGNVSADQATRNVQAIIEQLDPPRFPRIGAATAPEHPLPADTLHLFGSDGLGDANFAVAELHHPRTSEKVISDEIRAAPGEITILALGPLTNLANLFRRDPTLTEQVSQIYIMGGTYSGPGNVTPAAEFNFYCDPMAARDVFRLATPKTLIPLDVTNQVVMTFGMLDQLPNENSKAGKFLRKILPYAFRTHRQELGLEGISLHDAVALVALTNPELFSLERVAGDIETVGELTMGSTVFDRRARPLWRNRLDVAVEVEAAAAMDAILRSLADAGRQS